MAIELPVGIRVIGLPEAKKALGSLAGVAAGIFSAAKMVSFAKAGIEQWSKMQTASNQLTAALGHQSKGLEQLAQVTSRLSVFHDEEITQGYKRLAMYGLTEAQIKRMSPVMVDLAAVTGSTETAARLLGQSIMHGTGRISMYGIKVDKTASVTDRFNSILKQCESAFGGQAKAAFDAMNPLEKMHKIIMEASAGIGDAFVPSLNDAADLLPDLREAFANVGKTIITVFKVVGFAGDLVVDLVQRIINIFLKAAALIPGPWQKAMKSAEKFTGFLAESTEKTMGNLIKGIGNTWDKGYQEQCKSAQKAARLKIEMEEEANKEAKKRAKDRLELVKKLEHDAAQVGLSEGEKKLADLAIKYEQEKVMLAGNNDALINLDKVYAEQKKEIMDDIAEAAKEKAEREKKTDEKAEKEKQKAKDRFDAAADSKTNKRYKSEWQKLKDNYNTDKALLEKNGYDTTALTEQFEREKHDLKEKYLSEGLSSITNNLRDVASKHKEFTGAYKVTAIGQATIDTYKSAQSAYASLAGIPIIGPALGVAAAAAAIEAGLSNIQSIATAKFAYGGVVSGGIPGKDSVPAMLTPGEIVYNPAHPNSMLSDMITNNNTNNNRFQMGNIIVQGSVDNRTIGAISDATERALISAMRKMQVMGKITASGMKIRS